MSTFDLVIFDCDGVLIDSEPLASRTLARAMTTAGMPISSQQALVDFTGKSLGDIRQTLLERGLEDFDGLHRDWQVELFGSFASDLRPMAGIEDLLDRLDAPICVASNSGHERLRASLGLTPLWQRFAPRVFSADDVPRPKPAPDLVQHCLERCGARPERSVMIDDSAHGIAAARAAGVLPIGFVDPADIRPDRAERLAEAGAHHIVTGAGALSALLDPMIIAERKVASPA